MFIQIEPGRTPRHPDVKLVLDPDEPMPEPEIVKSMLLAAFQKIGLHLPQDWLIRLEPRDD